MRLRNLRGSDYPGISEWTLDAVTCILIKGGRGAVYTHMHKGSVKVDQGPVKMLASKLRAMRPQAKEC